MPSGFSKAAPVRFEFRSDQRPLVVGGKIPRIVWVFFMYARKLIQWGHCIS